jgi:FkbM family methyltransferase
MEYFIENFIEKLLTHVTEPRGFYIEAGANDGISFSYTYDLEKRGWKGLLIEPSEYILPRLMNNRSRDNIFTHCALVAAEEITEIHGDFDGSPMSSVGGTMLNRPPHTKVAGRTLNSILIQYGITRIDLLSLDVEGYEIEVLKGFDLRFYHPTYVVIEIANKYKDVIMGIFTDAGYSLLDNLTNFDHRSAVVWDNSYDDFLFKYNGSNT